MCLPVGPLVGLLCGALGFGGGVAEREDERLGADLGHLLAHSLGERAALGTVIEGERGSVRERQS